MPTPTLNPPKHKFDIPLDLKQAYYLSLGRFIHEFGALESHLSFMMRRYSIMIITQSFYELYESNWFTSGGTEELQKVYRALVGRQQSANLAATIKRLLKITNADEEMIAETNRALRHFQKIKDIRDKLVHNSAGFRYEDGWVMLYG